MANYDDLPPVPDDIPPGCAMPLTWLALGLLVGCGGFAAVGYSAYGSESAGVNAAQLAAFPLGFALSGALAGVVTHFAAKKSPNARFFVPLGCGCLGGVFALGTVGAFFALIFPAL